MSKQDPTTLYKYEIYRKKKHENKDIDSIFSYAGMEESVSGSQNFCLRLSDGSNATETRQNITDDTDVHNDKDIVVISDSSSASSSPKYPNKQRYKYHQNFTRNKEVHILESTDSDISDSGDEQIFQWKNNKKNNVNKCNEENISKNRKKENNILFTSDETSSSNSEKDKGYTPLSYKTSNTCISLTPKNVCDTLKQVNNTTPKLSTKYVNNTNTPSSRSTTSTSSSIPNQATRVLTPHGSIYKNNRSTPQKLTKENTRNIIKNIKSTRIVYESPRVETETNVIINETIDENIHPAISPKNSLKARCEIIDETPVDSESDIIPATQITLTNPPKTHVKRFLDAPSVNKDSDKICTELSERKKKQISQWLMTHSLEPKSDSSFSNVPDSNRNSISSGNSSLERLEMNYETPNNRGQILRGLVNDAGVTLQDYNRKTPSTVSKQTTLHNFVRKSKNDTHILQTPKNNSTNNISHSASISDTPKNMDIMECADILDKLYGNVWRSKADILLPTSEPRKNIVHTKNRAVQTEKKTRNKGSLLRTDSENEDSDTSLKDLKIKTTLTKKNVRRRNKYRDSFINDESSESDNATLYYTALTNPRSSTKSIPAKPTPMSVTAKRAIAICDSDSGDDEDINSENRIPDLERRKLSYSDDEDESSDTSEFDPGDNVPPKPISTKEVTKSSRPVPKTTTRIEQTLSNNQKYQKCNSFLASLSESVPISNAHPDARKYRTDFKNNKEYLCRYLFKLYNEQVFDKKLPEDMSIEWNVRMRGTAGFCYNKKSLKTLGGLVKSSRIVLATKVLDTPDRLRDTLIHEMCHAAAWLINDVSDGHGPFWTGWANKAMKTFPELPPIRRCHDYQIKTKFTYKCVDCGYSIGRHSKSLDVEKKRCGHCYGRFELLINKTTKSGTVQMQTPKREPSAFALYVKQNYNSVKKECNAKHGEVMKILGQQFSAIKIAKKHENGVENEPNTPY